MSGIVHLAETRLQRVLTTVRSISADYPLTFHVGIFPGWESRGRPWLAPQLQCRFLGPKKKGPHFPMGAARVFSHTSLLLLDRSSKLLEAAITGGPQALERWSEVTESLMQRMPTETTDGNRRQPSRALYQHENGHPLEQMIAVCDLCLCDEATKNRVACTAYGK